MVYSSSVQNPSDLGFVVSLSPHRLAPKVLSFLLTTTTTTTTKDQPLYASKLVETPTRLISRSPNRDSGLSTLDSRSRCQFVGRSASINSAAAQNLNCWLESETSTTRQSDTNINKLKLHAVSRPTWTSEGKRRSSLNLVV